MLDLFNNFLLDFFFFFLISLLDHIVFLYYHDYKLSRYSNINNYLMHKMLKFIVYFCNYKIIYKKRYVLNNQ